jgi:hypothetical protein
MTCKNRQNWRAGCTIQCACKLRQGTGYNLTTLFGMIEGKEISEIPAIPRKKHGWLPLLTILFMISYGLMTMLIVEQGQTIESQRALIRELFRDSSELSAVKMKAIEGRHQAQASTQNPSSQNPSTQAPAAQAPSSQAPSKAPSSQAGPLQHAQNQAKPKADFQMPSKPASDLVDHRRALVTI